MDGALYSSSITTGKRHEQFSTSLIILYRAFCLRSDIRNCHLCFFASHLRAPLSVFFYFSCSVISQGSFFLSLWPAIADKRLGPAPAPGIHPHGDTHPIIGLELPDYGGKVLFPTELRDHDVESLDFNSLDQNTQELLIDITQQDTFSRYARNEATSEE